MNEIMELNDFMPVFNVDALLQKLHCENAKPARAKMAKLVEQATALARPRAIAMLAPVDTDSLAASQIRIGNTVFSSELMRDKVGGLGRAFPFLATEGPELAAWGEALPSETDRYLARAIREAAVKGAQLALEQIIASRFGIPILSCMNPGSIAQWPIEEQAILFDLLGEYATRLGVLLLPSMLMDPAFSVSGIYFQTDKKYYNCQLCPREGCPNRRAKRLA